jgi:hypothetical protein
MRRGDVDDANDAGDVCQGEGAPRAFRCRLWGEAPSGARRVLARSQAVCKCAASLCVGPVPPTFALKGSATPFPGRGHVTAPSVAPHAASHDGRLLRGPPPFGKTPLAPPEWPAGVALLHVEGREGARTTDLARCTTEYRKMKGISLCGIRIECTGVPSGIARNSATDQVRRPRRAGRGVLPEAEALGLKERRRSRGCPGERLPGRGPGLIGRRRRRFFSS